jgi:CubicO group peptidase (beta-lactamase class C family)
VLDTSFLQASEAAALQWDVPALALGVAIGGRAETAAVGACEPGTLFRIASITKPFTALLALELLDLEETTGVWPEDVRVRHLLSHTSGFDSELPGGRDAFVFGDGDDALAREMEEVRHVRRFLGVEQCWSYANSGYWLAGHLCAIAAGTLYEDALAARILRPLGLEATSFGEPELHGTGAEAARVGYPRARRPSGGLVSNVGDLLRFGTRVLAEPRLRIVLGKPVRGVYGLGLQGDRVGGVEVWGHTGSYGGFQSSLLTVPDRDAVFVGLTNASLGSKALYDVENEFLRRVVGAVRGVPQTVAMPEEVRESFSGQYANGDGWYEVSPAIDGVVVAFDDGEYAARPVGDRTFEIVGGNRVRERFDFPLEGFGRFGSRLAERIA